MANEWLEALLILQDRDTRRDNIIKQIAYIPEEIAKDKASIAQAKAKLEERELTLKKLEVDHRDLEGEVAVLEEALVKYKTQQMEVKKNEEYTALEHEINNTKSKIDAIETKDLEMLEALDLARNELAKEKAITEKDVGTFQAHIKTLKEAEASFRAELDEAEAAVKKAESAVDKDILEDYSEVKDGVKRPPYVVPMSESKCQGCHLKVSGDVDSSVRKRMSGVHCDSCGRILYFD